MNANIFAIATQNKFRYPYKGLITTEDLWDLNLEQLDVIYKTLNKEVTSAYDDDKYSLMAQTSCGPKGVDAILSMKINIVKYIFDEKFDTARKREAEAVNAEKKRRILEVLAKKQDESYNNMSEDELREMLNELG